MAEAVPEDFAEPPAVYSSSLTGIVIVNRSPVMILWSAIVARETLGTDWAESLSLASAVAALNAQAKASSIWGSEKEEGAPTWCEDGPLVAGKLLLGREVPACRVDNGATLSPPVRNKMVAIARPPRAHRDSPIAHSNRATHTFAGQIRGITKGRAVHPSSANDNIARAFGKDLGR